MDPVRAQQLIDAERERITSLLATSSASRLDDSAAERDAGGGGDTDGAQPLEHEALDLAVQESLNERLAALTRAEERIGAGTYGRSVESGLPIPDERLEADPAAELTVAEAAQHAHRDY